VTTIATAFAVGTFAAWLSAFVHGVWSLAHLSGKNSLGQMLFHGIRWFDAENFTPRGQELQRRFVRSFVAFFVCVLGSIMAAAVGSASRPG
jgi:hypothetical protein